MTKQIELSKRLKQVADFVSYGNRVCDVGCDHGYVSIYLLEQKISPLAIAMDVNKGPLVHARENIEKQQLQDYIEIRLSDGLAGYHEGEADSLLIAGMGGRLMVSILKKELTKTWSFQELILQPQSEIFQVREALGELGFVITEEAMVYEEEKYYTMMKAVRNTNEKGPYVSECEAGSSVFAEDELYYGKLLIQQKNPVLLDFLEHEKSTCQQIFQELTGEEKRSARVNQRIEELKSRLKQIERVLEDVRA